MARHKDIDWRLNSLKADNSLNPAEIQIAVLMDLRDQLQIIARKLSALECPNFIAIPRTLTRIARNTTKPKRKKATRV